MKTNKRALAALAGSALVALIAFPAFAGEDCDGECGIHPPPSPPPLPGLPSLVNTTGTYFVALGTIQNQQYQQGYFSNGTIGYFGGGPNRPIGGDGRTVSIGGPNNNVLLAPTLTPLAAVRATATATTPQDPNFPDFDIVARGDIQLSYRIDLHANSQAAADALTARLTVDGAIAHVTGDWSLTATGASWGSVVATTGTAQGLQDSFFSACSLIDYSGHPEGCGAGSYSLGLNFVNGASYLGGDSLDFYSLITLSASANAGPPNLGYYPGTLDAYIDPSIFFSADLDLSNYSLSVGGVGSPLTAGGAAGGVPEPAAWALMLVGFGGIGAAIRRRRHTPQGLRLA